jgi:hypothetical protein
LEGGSRSVKALIAVDERIAKTHPGCQRESTSVELAGISAAALAVMSLAEQRCADADDPEGAPVRLAHLGEDVGLLHRSTIRLSRSRTLSKKLAW